MNANERAALLESDLGFLNDITVHEIDGKLMMGDADIPFNVAVIFKEKDFVQKWIMPFALGNDHGINYFDQITWYNLTNKGTQAAMVVDDETNEPVLLVRPMISHNLSPRDFELLRITSQHIQQMQADTLTTNDPNASMPAARMLKEQISAKRLTIPELVSPEFFTKHGINPKAEQKVYYIKDIILEKKGDIKDINRSREILYKLEEKQPVTKEEIKFLYTLSKGQFIVEGLLSESEIQGNAERETPIDPMEC